MSEKKNSSEFELNETNRLLKQLASRRLAFYRGIISGLGASLGATIVIALLLWITSQLEYTPLIGDVAKFLNSFLENNVTNGPTTTVIR